MTTVNKWDAQAIKHWRRFANVSTDPVTVHVATFVSLLDALEEARRDAEEARAALARMRRSCVARENALILRRMR